MLEDRLSSTAFCGFLFAGRTSQEVNQKIEEHKKMRKKWIKHKRAKSFGLHNYNGCGLHAFLRFVLCLIHSWLPSIS